MSKFHVLFDEAEPSPIADSAYAPYGNLGFPAPHHDRPWTYANFVQSMDGIASFRGRHATGGDLAQSEEDHWLMQLLRAHADAILLGLGTLMEETLSLPHLNAGRGPVYRVEDARLRELRGKLGRKREKVVFVTNSAKIDPAAFRVFDGDEVDAFILTSSSGAARLRGTKVRVLVSGGGDDVDLPAAMRMLRAELGIGHLLCEGGPTLYGSLSRAGLIDEKFLTVAPLEIGLKVPPEQAPSAAERANPPRERPTTFTAPGFTWENAPQWRWMSSRRVGSHEFNRYRIDNSARGNRRH